LAIQLQPGSELRGLKLLWKNLINHFDEKLFMRRQVTKFTSTNEFIGMRIHRKLCATEIFSFSTKLKPIFHCKPKHMHQPETFNGSIWSCTFSSHL